MRSLAFYLSIGVLLLLLSSCTEVWLGPDPDWKAPEFTATFESIDIEDSVILGLTYSTYVTPAGFYHEDLQGGSVYYESNLSIAPTNLRQPPFYYLSTNSRQQALAWSESSAVNSAYYRDLVSERETDRYFEFRRVYAKNPQDILLSRVHKLSYLDRSMYYYFTPTDHIGRLNARPIDEDAVRNLVEYLWFVENYNWYGSKVLAIVTATRPDSVYCVIYQLSFVGGDWGLYDDVSLHRTVVAVSKWNSDIVRQDQVLRHVRGHGN